MISIDISLNIFAILTCSLTLNWKLLYKGIFVRCILKNENKLKRFNLLFTLTLICQSPFLAKVPTDEVENVLRHILCRLHLYTVYVSVFLIVTYHHQDVIVSRSIFWRYQSDDIYSNKFKWLDCADRLKRLGFFRTWFCFLHVSHAFTWFNTSV